MSKWAIGTRWRATNSLGYYSEIWLDDRKDPDERWRWAHYAPDGKSIGNTLNWTISYSDARIKAGSKLTLPGEKQPRFYQVETENGKA